MNCKLSQGGALKLKIDSHVHFIDYNETDYPWIGDHMQCLRTHFGPNDLKPLLEAIEFNGVVAVQARQTLQETQWLLSLADKHPLIKGVVGWVDLRSDQVEKQIEAFMNYPAFKGVRHVIHDEIDDDFMLRADFNRGLALLKECDLSYDILIFEKLLPQTIKLIERHPDQRFVIDHIAKPRIKEQKIDHWYEHMKVLASFDNVYCKVSGMVTEADWDYQDNDIFQPYLSKIFELFTAQRLMIGSDWPVCTVVRDYQSVMNIVLDFLQDRTEEERQYILGQTCIEFYKL